MKRKIQDIVGVGKLYINNEYVATVKYNLTIEEEFISSKSLQGTELIPGMQIIVAHFSVVDGERDLISSDIYVLTLEDGRQWQCVIPSGNLNDGIYTAQSSGNKGIITN